MTFRACSNIKTPSFVWRLVVPQMFYLWKRFMHLDWPLGVSFSFCGVILSCFVWTQSRISLLSPYSSPSVSLQLCCNSADRLYSLTRIRLCHWSCCINCPSLSTASLVCIFVGCENHFWSYHGTTIWAYSVVTNNFLLSIESLLTILAIFIVL